MPFTTLDLLRCFIVSLLCLISVADIQDTLTEEGGCQSHLRPTSAEFKANSHGGLYLGRFGM